MTTKFAESLSSWNVDNISVARIAEALYSDYSRDNPHVSRMQALDFWDAALKAASENAKYTMVHGGNVYCSPYADIITDTSDSYSNFDMQDHSVPFYQMVFSAKKLITSYGINTSVDYEKEFMKVLECGTNLKFNLIYGDVAQLVNTPYNTMVSYSYEYWKDIIVEQYHAMQEVAQFAGEDITLHEILDDDVTLTVYESGKVVVNNGDKPYYYDGKKVGPRAYLVLTGGTK